MLNKFFIMGRLTRTPELRHTPNGRVVANFAIAHELSFKDSDGNKITEFYDIVSWNNTAEFAAKYLDRGRQIVIAGSGRMRSFTDREGIRRTKFEIHADEIYFAEKPSQSLRDSSPEVGAKGLASPFLPRPWGEVAAARLTERGKGGSAADGEGNFSDWEELIGEDEEVPF